jgi:hypothetical protein
MFDDGTTRSVPASSMPALIPKPVTSNSEWSHLLPSLLNFVSKIRYEHDGQYHKGFLSKSKEGVHQFSYKSHLNKKSKDLGRQHSRSTYDVAGPMY